jgi:AcrR family transcriptional regulator
MTSTPRAAPDPDKAEGTVAKRKPPAQRRAEIVETAARIALEQGLQAVTSASVAEALGVYPGLIHHYFRTVDSLIAAGFAHAAEQERTELFALAEQASGSPLEQFRALLAALLDEENDMVGLLWLDAWQASRQRPPLRDEVAVQTTAWLEQLVQLIAAGVACGDFVCGDPATAALRILAMVDGLSIQAALRASAIDYTGVHELVVGVAEGELGLSPGRLRMD